MQEESDLQIEWSSIDRLFHRNLEIRIKWLHNETNENKMIVMDPYEILKITIEKWIKKRLVHLRSTVSNCIDSELIIDSNIRTPVITN